MLYTKLQTEKLNSHGEKNGAAHIKNNIQGQRSSQRHSLKLIAFVYFSMILETLKFPPFFFFNLLAHQRVHRHDSLLLPHRVNTG